MEQETSAQPSMADLLARVGVQVTPEGRARAKARLAESRRRNSEDADETASFLAGLRSGARPA
jgi:hypothetical protein